jgi:hypothetical protein
MAAAFKNHPVIGALSLEYRRGIMKAMGENVDFGVLGAGECAIVPNETVAVVEGSIRHQG